MSWGGALGAEAAESIAAVAYEALSAGYSEKQELDCDAWSYRAMRKDGCPHKDCIAMTQIFLEREKAESKLAKRSYFSFSSASNRFFAGG